MTPEPRCAAFKKNHERCKLPALEGKQHCMYHSDDPADRAKHLEQSRNGGTRRDQLMIEPLASVIDVDAMPLDTAQGIRELLGATLRQLARLPFSTKTAGVIGQCSLAARAVIETSDLEARLAALEARDTERPRHAA